ncbi:prepilin-type N-terminal cleavage/methylation domain-containing protein [Thioflexithrix psekupsensis]|uniref:Type II secretion system protein GspI n=1 Tax=Thioflexithrix psekupsensis TaxID=1570016 RepID=A0A251X8K8_9GAMM|nr:prepilin-type N-terminal cleavage/methylation domain-containing protein [Thioflexithrix psekupsensis]OUD14311.1 hypothetical protein TPSD3_08285 [Thioflexithrix psekupsensis]
MTQRGFTLLEALVALVLIATVGMALLSWLNSSLDSLSRMEHAQRRIEATRNALAFIDTLNPMQNPQGEAEIGVYTFRWQANLVKPEQDGVNHLGAQSLYKLGLYQVTIDIFQFNQLITQLSLTQVGYEQVRQPAALDFDG